MPSPEESLNKTQTLSRSSSKRKLQEQKKPSPDSDRSTCTPTQTTLPFTKRLKTSHSAANIGPLMDMSRTQGLSARPKVVNLTSTFQPNTGARKLVIKNLRTKSRLDAGEYYQRTWDELDDTLTSIFKKQIPAAPLEVLCRGVEATCRRGQAEKLALHLQNRCRGYLEKELLPKIENEAESTNVEALRVVHKYWTEWNKQAVSASILLYLN